MNDLFSHVRSYHEYQSNIYWLPFKGELKTDKTFPPTFRKDPRSGTGLGRNYRKLRFPGHPIKRGGGGGKRILCDGSFAEFLRSRSTPLCATLPRRRGGMHGEFYSSVRGKGVEEGFRPSLAPPSAPRGKEIRANKKATLRILIPGIPCSRKYGDHHILKFLHRVILFILVYSILNIEMVHIKVRIKLYFEFKIK